MGIQDKNLPKPKAILCISAHWETRETSVKDMEKQRPIHDFGGFPQALFDVQCSVPRSRQSMASPGGKCCGEESKRGTGSGMGLESWLLELTDTDVSSRRYSSGSA